MKILMKAFLVTIMIFGVSLNAQASWVLVYETDASGNAIYGDFNDLENSVNTAENIKVVMDVSAIVGGAKKSVVYCESTHSDTGYVACITPKGISTDAWNFDIFDNAYLTAAIINSQGHLLQNRWFLDGSFTHNGKTNHIVPMKWYVEDF